MFLLSAEYEESLIIDREKSLYPQLPHSPFPTSEFENQQQQQVPISNPFTTLLLTTTNDRQQQNETSGEFDQHTSVHTVRTLRLAHFTRNKQPPLRFRHSVGSPSLSFTTNNNEVSSTPDMDVNYLGDDEVDNFLESMEDNNVDDQVNFDSHDYLNVENFLTDLKERYELRSKKENNVIIQRDLDRFWPVVLKQTFDLSQQNLKIRFAGEVGADAGGLLREFLTLAMRHIHHLPNLFFGGAEALYFKSSSSNIVSRDCFKIGQIVGLSTVFPRSSCK